MKRKVIGAMAGALIVIGGFNVLTNCSGPTTASYDPMGDRSATESPSLPSDIRPIPTDEIPAPNGPVSGTPVETFDCSQKIDPSIPDKGIIARFRAACGGQP